MSAARITRDSTVVGPARTGVTPGRVLRSEWHKFWTLRSTWVTLSATSLLVLGTGLVMAVGHEPDGGGSGSVGDPVVLTLIGIQFGQIILTVLGVLFSAGEYSTGMIRASLTAVPERLPVLWGQGCGLHRRDARHRHDHRLHDLLPRGAAVRHPRGRER
ncbi:hypothetical protein [Streptomyces niveus]|uniref:hypothetical protein n=1 Tax=Streptomyces niveus TaxID=193462 RepID=UPI0036D26AE7